MAAPEPKKEEDAGPKYVSSEKHSNPRQMGRRGSLCTEVSAEEAQKLLDESVLSGKMRYATDGERAFAAEEDNTGGWHGWPVGYKEIVPETIWRQWVKNGKIRRKSTKKYWDSGTL